MRVVARAPGRADAGRGYDALTRAGQGLPEPGGPMRVMARAPGRAEVSRSRAGRCGSWRGLPGGPRSPGAGSAAQVELAARWPAGEARAGGRSGRRAGGESGQRAVRAAGGRESGQRAVRAAGGRESGQRAGAERADGVLARPAAGSTGRPEVGGPRAGSASDTGSGDPRARTWVSSSKSCAGRRPTPPGTAGRLLASPIMTARTSGRPLTRPGRSDPASDSRRRQRSAFDAANRPDGPDVVHVEGMASGRQPSIELLARSHDAWRGQRPRTSAVLSAG